VFEPTVAKYSLSAGLAFGAALVGGRLMMACNIIDVPNERSSHIVPTPKSGGIAVILGFVIGLCSLGFVDLYHYERYIIPWRILGMGMLAFAAIGFLDDLRPLKPLFRFGWQFLVAALVVGFGSLSFTNIPLPGIGDVVLGMMGRVMALFWLVAYTNAFNFMDGLNGLSGGTAILTSLFIALFAQESGNTLLHDAALLLAAASVGFLLFNFPRASLFLGDVGSYFIGFALASFGLIAHQSTEIEKGLSVWTLLILFFIYVFDTGFTLIRRAWRKENVFTAHRSHLYQLLQQTGWSHSAVAMLYWGFTLLQGWIALTVHLASPLIQCLALAGLFWLASIYAWWVMRRARKKGLSS
jgi:UDP-N-acetylmuramyl pentapeptide phosphotransferase/UDP-N-acetylglucosamine-1-phosphate transferase